MRTQAIRLALVAACAVALLACDQATRRSDATPKPSFLPVIEAQWTDAARQRIAKLSHEAQKQRSKGAFQFALPELRIYNRRQQLIFQANGAEPGKTAATLDRVIAANRPVVGPTLQATLADLETREHRRVTMANPGDHVIIFDYWADWCIPCKALEKELLAWAKEQPAGSVQIVRAEADPLKLARERGQKFIMLKRDRNGKLIKQEMD